MAPRGRKRKAQAAEQPADKREKLAGAPDKVEEATVVIEHW